MPDDRTVNSNLSAAVTEVQPLPRAPFDEGRLPEIPGHPAVREIARGGMGVVYAAHDPVFDRAVAVKVMHPGQDAGRFVVEAQITAQLPHPGVPPVHALGTLPDGRPYLVMKLIHGRTLAAELHGAAPGRQLAAFEAICQTVGFAHARGIIHRDLKPANVMVGAFGEAYVMDWGLAKRVGAAPDASELSATGSGAPFETVAGQVKGTPAFMAPEQARGEPVGPAADVFALGGILAVALTGKPPFLGDTVLATVLKAARADMDDCFAQLAACGADAELVAVAKGCLAPDPGARFPNGEAVAEAVAAYRAGVEGRLYAAERDRAAAEARAAEEVNTRREAEARAAAERSKAEEQRKRRRVQLALVALVVLGGAGAAGAAWHHDRERAELRAQYEREEAASRLAAEREEGKRRAERERDAADRRAAEARLVGERDAEARAKVAQARAGAGAALALARDLRKQYRFKEAEAAVAQAASLAAGAPELAAEVARTRADLALVVRLDGVRFRKWTFVAGSGRKGAFDTQSAAQGYKNALAEYGLDMTALDPAEAARRVAALAVKGEVVAALDDWALYEPDEAVRNRLLDVGRRADPGPWTDRLRDPAVRGDKAAVAKLTAEADTADVSPAALSVLAELMDRAGLKPAAVLAVARGRHPAEFELAFVLGLWQGGDRGAAAYEAARALRPDHLTTWNNLGYSLYAVGDFDGAAAALRGAIRLDPRYPSPHNNLGATLYARGDYRGAEAAWAELVRLAPNDAKAHDNLGLARHRLENLKGAAAEFREAIRLDPQLAPAHSNLGAVFADQGDLKEAIVWVRRATQIDPKYPNAHAQLGYLLFQTGDVPGARAALTEAARLNPPRYSALLAKLPLPVAPSPREVKRP